VTLPDGKVVGCKELYKNYPIRMYGQLFLADLYKFTLTDFGVILGMDWLARYQAQINCPEQWITLKGPNGERIVLKGKAPRIGVRLITALKASKLLGRGCKGFLCNIVETVAREPSLQDIPVVREFSDVFQEGIPGMPPIREVEFRIDLVIGATPVSKAPYRMALAELKN